MAKITIEISEDCYTVVTGPYYHGMYFGTVYIEQKAGASDYHLRHFVKAPSLNEIRDLSFETYAKVKGAKARRVTERLLKRSNK